MYMYPLWRYEIYYSAVGPFHLPAPQSGTLPDFIQDPTISADCFRRLLKTYLLAQYQCI